MGPMRDDALPFTKQVRQHAGVFAGTDAEIGQYELHFQVARLYGLRLP